MYKIGWYLFKTSGKMAYSGTSDIPDSLMLWHQDYVRHVIRGQKDVVNTAFEGNTLVTYDLAEHDKDPNYKHFNVAMFKL
jgi:hypothetical protein